MQCPVGNQPAIRLPRRPTRCGLFRSLAEVYGDPAPRGRPDFDAWHRRLSGARVRPTLCIVDRSVLATSFVASAQSERAVKILADVVDRGYFPYQISPGCWRRPSTRRGNDPVTSYAGLRSRSSSAVRRQLF